MRILTSVTSLVYIDIDDVPITRDICNIGANCDSGIISAGKSQNASVPPRGVAVDFLFNFQPPFFRSSQEDEDEEEKDYLRGPKLKQQVSVLHICDVYTYATDAKTSPPL